MDISQPAPKLPAGHPFANVQLDHYWSANTDVEDTGEAFRVNFTNGQVDFGNKINDITFVWCVRGGQGAAVQ